MAKATQSRGWWPKIIGVGVVFLVGIVLGAAGKVSVDGEPDCTPSAAIEQVVANE